MPFGILDDSAVTENPIRITDAFTEQQILIMI
jgi:hypothetical protein